MLFRVGERELLVFFISIKSAFSVCRPLLGCSRAAFQMAYRVVLVLFSAGSPVYLCPLV